MRIIVRSMSAPYSAPDKSVASETPSEYMTILWPGLSHNSRTGNSSLQNIPTGSPDASTTVTVPSHTRSGGGCPALQISTLPFDSARPQITVAYCEGNVLSHRTRLACESIACNGNPT